MNSYSNSPNPPQIHSDPISRAKDITPSRPGPQRSSMLQLNFAAVDDPLVMTKIHRVSRWQVFAVSAVSSVLLGEIGLVMFRACDHQFCLTVRELSHIRKKQGHERERRTIVDKLHAI